LSQESSGPIGPLFLASLLNQNILRHFLTIGSEAKMKIYFYFQRANQSSERDLISLVKCRGFIQEALNSSDALMRVGSSVLLRV
jgi:hypothetical protein